MSHRTHQIHLKILRPDEQILHNCSSHPIIHLEEHLFYFLGLLIPFVAMIFLARAGVFKDFVMTAWFLYACYGLVLTTYFFIKGVNFELGGCVITNQRLLLFGYTGLWQAVEREILPNKIEDFKIEKKGLLSLLFNTACIHITTSNRQTTTLWYVIDPEKIQDAYATLAKSSSAQTPSHSGEAAWIDEALGHPKDKSINLDAHRQGMIHNIADVFKDNKK